MRRMLIALAIMVLAPAIGMAADPQIAVEEPWARASIGTSRPGAAYFTVRNAGDAPVILTGIRTEVAGKAEIHSSSTGANGVSTMAPAGDITIAPGEAVALEPGGLHTMLMQLKSPLVEGQTFPLTLVFEDGSEVPVEMPVLGIAARGPSD